MAQIKGMASLVSFETILVRKIGIDLWVINVRVRPACFILCKGGSSTGNFMMHRSKVSGKVRYPVNYIINYVNK